jgi:hypothetical protein
VATRNISKPDNIVYEIKNEIVRVNFEVFKVIYDAQLKKLLAYTIIFLAVFIPQLQILMNSNVYLLPFAFILFLAQIYFSIAAITKFQEIQIMERQLNEEFFNQVLLNSRPVISRHYDRFIEKASTIKDNGNKTLSINNKITLFTYSVFSFEFLILIAIFVKAFV